MGQGWALEAFNFLKGAVLSLQSKPEADIEYETQEVHLSLLFHAEASINALYCFSHAVSFLNCCTRALCTGSKRGATSSPLLPTGDFLEVMLTRSR